jgi:hypothetical protein
VIGAFRAAARPFARHRVLSSVKRAYAAIREAAKEIAKRSFAPSRPAGMCHAQHTDYLAACEGKITWREYFSKWGDDRLAL